MNRRVIYTIMWVSLTAIMANQIYWIISMYDSYKKEIVLDINKAIEKAAYMEITERGEGEGGFSAFPLYSAYGDTSRYIKKTIIGENSTFDVIIDRQDPNANLKIAQTALKDIIPPDILRINEFFFREMRGGRFLIEETYVEYYDLNEKTLIESSKAKLADESYLSSGMFVMDIANSMGLKAYARNPIMTILGRMIFQFALSVVLIIIAMTGMILLGRTIFRQWKEEKMRQDSVSAMTHEFRRPISAAVSLVTLIPYYLGRNDPDKVSSYAELTVEELNKLTAYTRRIQQICNNDKSTVSLNQSEIELRPFMEFLTGKYLLPEDVQGQNPAQRPVKIRLDVRPEHPVIYADRIHFANVIENLIENAIKYSGDHPELDISVDYQNDFLRISVKDNGIGIAAPELKHIFDKFYRADRRDVRCKAGFGLGLTYVKSIVELHGGRVEANSRGIGRGSEFIVFMPIDHDVN